MELDVRVMSDDGALPKDGYLAGWGDDFLGCAERSGRCLDTQITMKEVIDKAGFTDIQERLYKCPIGGWPKGVVLKEAGKFNKAPSRTCGSFYYPPSIPASLKNILETLPKDPHDRFTSPVSLGAGES